MGDHHVGISSDDVEVLDTLRQMYGAMLVVDERAEDDFGIMTGAGRSWDGVRPLPVLLRGRCLVVRSRGQHRPLRRLDSELLIFSQVGQPTGTVLLPGLAALISGGRAVLVTEAVTTRITAIEGVLARAGIQLAEGPRIRLDPASHSIRILPALAELAVGDPLDAGPGEVELAQVFLTDHHRESSLTPGMFLARLLAHVDDQRRTPVSTTLEQVADLQSRFALDLLPLEPVEALDRAIASLRS